MASPTPRSNGFALLVSSPPLPPSNWSFPSPASSKLCPPRFESERFQVSSRPPSFGRDHSKGRGGESSRSNARFPRWGVEGREEGSRRGGGRRRRASRRQPREAGGACVGGRGLGLPRLGPSTRGSSLIRVWSVGLHGPAPWKPVEGGWGLASLPSQALVPPRWSLRSEGGLCAGGPCFRVNGPSPGSGRQVCLWGFSRPHYSKVTKPSGSAAGPASPSGGPCAKVRRSSKPGQGIPANHGSEGPI